LPEPLWDLAVKLAREYGANRTARTLRLEYNGRVLSASLKKMKILLWACGILEGLPVVPGQPAGGIG